MLAGGAPSMTKASACASAGQAFPMQYVCVCVTLNLPDIV